MLIVDADPGDNFDHWVLPDLFGGTSALLLYTGAETDRALAAQHFDAFGVRMATTDAWDTGLDDSRYRWRSQESRETDAFAVAKPLIGPLKNSRSALGMTVFSARFAPR
ncbi:MAG: hypothetical protein KJ057_14135 [Phycisphaerae bacterium]|nr:hypothetical protein [Phycisphaerae bacterium]